MTGIGIVVQTHFIFNVFIGKISKLQHTPDMYNCTLQKPSNSSEERIKDDL